MPSIFTKIIAGEIPCYKIAETSGYLAFLDVFPLAKGHVLVVPKKEIDYLFDMDSASYLGLMAFAQKIAIALKKVVPCQKIGVAVIGLEVAHAHVHLVPINTVGDINFSKEKLQLPKEELERLASLIKGSYDAS